MATLARWARSFGLTRAICILLLLALVPLRIVNPPPLEEIRLRTFDLYQSLRPRETVLRPVVTGDRTEHPPTRSSPIRDQVSGRRGRAGAAVSHRARVSGAGGKAGEGKRASRQLPEAGHRTKSPAARSSPIRHPLSGAIVRATVLH